MIGGVRKMSVEDANAAGTTVTALCEECEARMKALDHSELVPFFNVRPDEEPAGAVKQGYLWRRVSRKVMDTWERRWFILDEVCIVVSSSLTGFKNIINGCHIADYVFVD